MWYGKVTLVKIHWQILFNKFLCSVWTQILCYSFCDKCSLPNKHCSWELSFNLTKTIRNGKNIYIYIFFYLSGPYLDLEIHKKWIPVVVFFFLLLFFLFVFFVFFCFVVFFLFLFFFFFFFFVCFLLLLLLFCFCFLSFILSYWFEYSAWVT